MEGGIRWNIQMDSTCLVRFIQSLEDVILILPWIKAILLHFLEEEVQKANCFNHNGFDVHE